MVECEYSSKYSEFLSIVVLIDTWWNVNIVACGALAWYIKF